MYTSLFEEIVKIAKSLVPYVSNAVKSVGITAGVIALFGTYLVLVRVLRYRRYRSVHKKYQEKYEEGTLTPEEAQEVMRVSTAYDMPLLLNYSLAFALFKTYAVPSISKLLAATKELKSSETVSRRYADTEILIATWVGCPISGYAIEDPNNEFDPRAMIALARVNYLHSKYKISNEDFLYTLILFILEPMTWARNYGWRALSPLEEHAFYVFWTEIGKRMGIRDIPDSLEEMRAWAKAFEQERMTPHITNKDVAGYTLEELLYFAPKAFGIRTWVEGLTVCMLDEPVRIGMMKSAQPWYKHFIVWSTLRSIAFVQKWLLLPRSDRNYRYPVKLELTRNKDGSINPRMYPNKFQVRPWYKPESKTVFGRFWDRLLVLINVHSHVPDTSLRSGGYRLEEMGPLHMENMGNEECLQAAAKLQGCPISGPFTR